MSTIVGDKIKLTNYAYLLNQRGTGWVSEKMNDPNSRKSFEKVIDAIDIDWRPFTIKNFAYSGDENPSNVTQPGDILDTERVLDFISYSYSMGKNLNFVGYLDHNALDPARPTLMTNIGFNASNRTISYTYWPAVGSVYNVASLDDNANYKENPSQYGEIFNDYANNIASGMSSHAEGNDTKAYGQASHSEGLSTISNGIASHSEGEKTYTNGNSSHAEGFSTYALGLSAHSEGHFTYASYDYSHAEGYGSLAYSTYSHAEGQLTTTYGIAAHAEGKGTFASYDYSHAEGFNTLAYNVNSHAEGLETIAKGTSSHAEGHSTKSIGESSHSEGHETTASGDASHAEGMNATSSGQSSHAEGTLTTASGQSSHAEGWQSAASGYISHAEGYSTASAQFSHSEGYETTASENASHAEGNSTKASGQASHAEGHSTVASGNYSHAEGFSTYAAYAFSHAEGASTLAYNTYAHAEGCLSYSIGTYSHSEGLASYAHGLASHAEGKFTYAIGQTSHSEGDGTLASGQSSHAEGQSTIASGNYSHAQGISSTASGESSFASGNSSIASKSASTAIGLGAKASSVDGELALGKYNVSQSGYVFSIGDGSSDSNRHNIMRTDASGWTYISALASYVNSITTTKDHYATSYTDNFVTIDAFKEITRGEGDTSTAYQNTYNIKFTTYTLPTKNYIDKLLESKDVFRFAGTITFIGTTIDGYDDLNHNPGTSTVTWNPVHASNVYDEDDITYYAYDGKIGAVWKTTNSGYFGANASTAFYMAAGDLLLAYEDHSTPLANNSTGWVVIDTHVNFINNSPELKTNQNAKDRVLTDIHLKDDGTLSYTYAPIVAKDGYGATSDANRNKNADAYRFAGFLSNFAINTDNEKIELGYVRSVFKTIEGVGTAPDGRTYDFSRDLLNDDVHKDSRSNANDSITLLENVWLDEYGVLTYGTYTLSNFRNHHYTEITTKNSTYSSRYQEISIQNTSNNLEATYNSSTNISNDRTYFVTNVHLGANGHLSYAYTYVSGLKNHHNTYWPHDNFIYHVDGAEQSSDVNTYAIANNSTNVDKVTLVRGVNMSSQGTLTYSYLTVSGLKKHHHTLAEIENAGQANGRATNERSRDVYSSNDNLKVLTYAYVNEVGYLQTYYANVSNLRDHHKSAKNTTTYDIDVDNGGADSTTSHNALALSYSFNTYLTQDGLFGYTVGTYTISNLRTHHHTYTEAKGGSDSGLMAARTSASEKDINVNNANTSAKVLSYAFLTSDGTLHTSYYEISNLRDHHNSSHSTNTGSTDVDKAVAEDNELKITYISNVAFSADGTLTYVASSYTVTNLRKHHHTLAEIENTGQTNGRPLNERSRDVYESNNPLKVITYAYVNATGYLQTYYATVNNLLNHHKSIKSTKSNSINVTSTDTLVLSYISAVDLSIDGALSYTVSTYTVNNLNSHHHTLDEIHNANNNATSRNTAHNEHDIDLSVDAISGNDGSNRTFKVLSYVWLSSEGNLQSYYYNVDNIRKHHGTYTHTGYSYIAYSNKDSLETKNDTFGFISAVNMDDYGHLSYQHSSVTGIRSHHRTTYVTGATTYDVYKTTTTGDDSFGFISNLHLNDIGTLSYQTSSVTNLRKHHSQSNSSNSYNVSTGNSSGTNKLGFIGELHISEDGHLTYIYSSVDNLREHHHQLDSTLGNSYDVYKDTTIGTHSYDDGFGFLTNVNLDKYGTLTYTYSSIENLRKHHSQKSSAGTAYDVHGTTVTNKLGFIGEIHLDDCGHLSYVYSSIDNLRNHHDNITVNSSSKSYDVYKDTNVGTHDGDDGFGFLTNVNITANGTLSYQFATVVNLRKHHDTFKPTTATTTYDVYKNTEGDNSFGFITDVNLDEQGTLSYKYSTVTNLRKHHKLTGSASTSNSLNVNTAGNASTAPDDLVITYIDGITFNDYGYLAYHYATYTVYNLANHHSNAGTTINNGSIDVNASTAVLKFTYIANVNLSTDGKLTYTYSTYTISNLASHHSGSVSITNVANPGFDTTFPIITGVSLSETGTLSGTTATVKMPTRSHHSSTGSTATTTTRIIKNVVLSANGQLAYTYDNIWGTISSGSSGDDTPDTDDSEPSEDT